MQADLDRRGFIALLGIGTVAWTPIARAQQSMPVVGFLNGASPAGLGSRVDAFRAGLAEKGFVEGRGVAIEFRWGLGQYERLPEMAADLAHQKPLLLKFRSSLRWAAIPWRSGSLPA